ncbi:MAG: bax protein, partial [Marinobacter sp.]|nr:bax protein [Marinobacter sp.]
MSVVVRLSVFIVPLVAVAIWGSSYRPATATMIKDSAEDVEDLAQIDLPPLPAWANDPLPDFTRYHDTTEKKAAFFSFIYPRVVLANA